MYACGGAKNCKLTSELKSGQESESEFHGIVVGLEIKKGGNTFF